MSKIIVTLTLMIILSKIVTIDIAYIDDKIENVVLEADRGLFKKNIIWNISNVTVRFSKRQNILCPTKNK